MREDTHDVLEALRRYQSNLPVAGQFFRDAYAFLDWFADTYLEEAIPPVALRIAKLRHGRMAEYSPADGSMLPTITLDPTKSKSGLVALEWLAHELVHHFEWTTGRAEPHYLSENFHSEEFRGLMMEIGLSVMPDTGAHRGYVGDLWENVLMQFVQDTGIDMSVHELPGPQEPVRKLHKWKCPAGDCGFSFRSRRTDLKVMCSGMGDDVHSPGFMFMEE